MKYYYYFLILLLIFPFNQGRRLRNNGKVRSLINSSSTPSSHSNDDNNLFIDTNSK